MKLDSQKLWSSASSQMRGAQSLKRLRTTMLGKKAVEYNIWIWTIELFVYWICGRGGAGSGCSGGGTSSRPGDSGKAVEQVATCHGRDSRSGDGGEEVDTDQMVSRAMLAQSFHIPLLLMAMSNGVLDSVADPVPQLSLPPCSLACQKHSEPGGVTLWTEFVHTFDTPI